MIFGVYSLFITMDKKEWELLTQWEERVQKKRHAESELVQCRKRCADQEAIIERYKSLLASLLTDGPEQTEPEPPPAATKPKTRKSQGAISGTSQRFVRGETMVQHHIFDGIRRYFESHVDQDLVSAHDVVQSCGTLFNSKKAAFTMADIDRCFKDANADVALLTDEYFPIRTDPSGNWLIVLPDWLRQRMLVRSRRL